MKRFPRLARVVLIPLAALSILIASAMPASAASHSGSHSSGSGYVARVLSMDW